MKLEKSIIERRIDLMKKEGVEFIFNADVGHSVSAEHILEEFDAVALCCGAKKARRLNALGIDGIKTGRNGADGGVMFAVDFLKEVTKSVLATSSALEQLNITPANTQIAQVLLEKSGIEIAGKNVIIVGGGDTGNDCCGSSIRLGCSSVTQIEMMPCPPVDRGANNPWPEWPKILKVDYGAEESIAKFGRPYYGSKNCRS